MKYGYKASLRPFTARVHIWDFLIENPKRCTFLKGITLFKKKKYKKVQSIFLLYYRDNFRVKDLISLFNALIHNTTKRWKAYKNIEGNFGFLGRLEANPLQLWCNNVRT